MTTLGFPLRKKAEVVKAAEGAGGSGLAEVAIGIDLGTTNSSAAFFSPDTKAPEVIPLEVGLIRNRIPSVVWYNQAEDRLIVGDIAKRAAARYPEAVRAEFKRDMTHASAVSYPLGEGDGARTETPQSLSTIVLREIRERCERELRTRLGREVQIRRAVITVPANFT